jgi:hypothetical protein
MRCVDLVGTWAGLSSWLDRAGVLVLPRMEGAGPLVRLDADIDPTRPAGPDDLARVVGRLRAVVERFGVPAVYVTQTIWYPYDEPEPAAGTLASLTIQVFAGGVLHELMMVAASYAAQREAGLDVSVGVW